MGLLERFKQVFNTDASEVYSAAGRVNLIGEHIDYCGGCVLPAALSLKCRVAVRANGTNRLRVAATTLDDVADIDLDNLDAFRDKKWGKYQAGVADELKKAGYKLAGLDIVYDCTVPFGSGLSSSAAIEVATAYALAKAGGNKIDKKDLAVISQRAENNFCGVNCGIMDQFASANGMEKHAVLLNCSTLDCEFIPLDLKDYVLVLSNCNKPHNLVESKYNERRGEVEAALELLKERIDGIERLADVTPEMLEKNKGLLSATLYKRARHVVTECDRVKQSVQALSSGDLVKFGELLNSSHISLRDDYEVTGIELDTLADAAWQLDYCLGSRMTGAGFGGCTVSVVKKSCVDMFKKAVGDKYRETIGYDASFYVAEIADGIIDEGKI